MCRSGRGHRTTSIVCQWRQHTYRIQLAKAIFITPTVTVKSWWCHEITLSVIVWRFKKSLMSHFSVQFVSHEPRRCRYLNRCRYTPRVCRKKSEIILTKPYEPLTIYPTAKPQRGSASPHIITMPSSHSRVYWIWNWPSWTTNPQTPKTHFRKPSIMFLSVRSIWCIYLPLVSISMKYF